MKLGPNYAQTKHPPSLEIPLFTQYITTKTVKLIFTTHTVCTPLSAARPNPKHDKNTCCHKLIYTTQHFCSKETCNLLPFVTEAHMFLSKQQWTAPVTDLFYIQLPQTIQTTVKCWDVDYTGFSVRTVVQGKSTFHEKMQGFCLTTVFWWNGSVCVCVCVWGGEGGKDFQMHCKYVHCYQCAQQY